MTLRPGRLQPKNIDDIDWKAVQYQYSYRITFTALLGSLVLPLVLGPWLLQAWIYPAIFAGVASIGWHLYQRRMKKIRGLFDHGKSRKAKVTNINLSKRGGLPNHAKPTIITVKWREGDKTVSFTYEVSPYHEIDERKLKRNVSVLTLPCSKTVIIADLFKF